MARNDAFGENVDAFLKSAGEILGTEQAVRSCSLASFLDMLSRKDLQLDALARAAFNSYGVCGISLS